ncbi:MAG: phenylacetate--CoA ligase family protein [Pirellulaceae bacterium]|nr:phenylacetate--CoA ligase family protein [Pirellulaceae bacterium]
MPSNQPESHLTTRPHAHQFWLWDQEQLQAHQLELFNLQLDQILPSNRFYQQKLASAGCIRLGDLNQLAEWPLTTKQELVDSALSSESGLSLHHTYSRSAYSRLHRTSGTRGQPLSILDTSDDWRWWSDTWSHVLQAAEMSAEDRVFLAFSFGPFIGFWSAHQACIDLGALVIPGGGMSALARLEFLRQSQANIVCCTPTYALHLAEVAADENFPLADLAVDRLIVAGEIGGSLPAVRQRIESAWQADVVDHAGATEIGPWGFGWRDGCGLHVIETSFIAEILPLPINPAAPETADVESPAPSKFGELVLTSLGRFGAPVIRYRTGDVVRVAPHNAASDRCRFMWLPDGVIGRVDDMLTIRGVNIFPSSLESLIRKLPEIGEYQVQVTRHRQLDELKLTVEADPDCVAALQKLLLVKLGLRIPIHSVARGTLPRSDAKARRWQDLRQ